MTRFAKLLAHQRRIRLLFFGLFIYCSLISVIIVPVEMAEPEATIRSVFDGVWWTVTTVTGVGYGDAYPLSVMGRILGMSLQMVGVIAFGLLVGMVTMAMNDNTNRYFYRKIFERLDTMEKKLTRIEKQNDFLIHNARSPQSPDLADHE
jgi:hypothetical protein